MVSINRCHQNFLLLRDFLLFGSLLMRDSTVFAILPTPLEPLGLLSSHEKISPILYAKGVNIFTKL